jgi:predicted ABC-type exoprotein transport system permease subunit
MTFHIYHLHFSTTSNEQANAINEEKDVQRFNKQQSGYLKLMGGKALLSFLYGVIILTIFCYSRYF